ncbi:tRNA (N6-threonylcarbamoyladenosine(37)-N6)-methyltransferase TrmO [Pseudomaricurvus sp.]|uniref:tRNA (N6-threonylcarbamoyladenosine(37)-N6)-methyltransferase TrmO n=1 Tax=Pseudomaricurvus sp. TaxID=2004510 RepID=UPI003F6C7CB0
MSTNEQTYHFDPVGWVHSPYKEKFATPRQPGLVTAAHSHITLRNDCNREEILRGLEGFSHLWLMFVFHEAIREDWKPMVRPPRLGGNQKVGVFASRSPFRPNPIGLSVVTLEGIKQEKGQWQIHIGGGDLLDQTPILDIKPYIPYADSHPQAQGNYADDTPETLESIEFNPQAYEQVTLFEKSYPSLEQLIRQVLSQQPEPAFHKSSERTYGMALYDLNIQWQRQGKTLVVTDVRQN